MLTKLRRLLAAAALEALTLTLSGQAHAAPQCLPEDVAELCQIERESRSDNPAFENRSEWTKAAEVARAQRQAARRARARNILEDMAQPTWRDLYRAGYVVAYGETPNEDLLALAIAIRALSLEPNDPSVRFLVAMTVDRIGKHYVGSQLYGRQKFFELNPQTGEVQLACLPNMITPPLPSSVGTQFHTPDETFPPCPRGVGRD